tara:strand:- start:207 stop:368 length:162 start_codon:yes stop_codon:yes gene_type:complete
LGFLRVFSGGVKETGASRGEEFYSDGLAILSGKLNFGSEHLEWDGMRSRIELK